MLVVATFPLAFLAGAATTALFGPASMAAAQRRRAAGVVAIVAIVLGLFFAMDLAKVLAAKHRVGFQPYWITAPASVVVALWLLLGYAVPGRAAMQRIWAYVLLANAWALAWPLVTVRSDARIYEPSACVGYILEHDTEHSRVLDRDPASHPAVTPLGAGAPLAMIFQIEALRGYNPLDVLRYKEYLQFTGDDDRPLRPLDGNLTFPVTGNYWVRNKQLLDLLGTRYLIQPSNPKFQMTDSRTHPPREVKADDDPRWQKVFEDPKPEAYLFIAGGVRQLPPYTVYENRDVFPRAFVVFQAAPLPARSEVLAALRTTDFKRQVLLEDYEATTEAASASSEMVPARIREYRPNRVQVLLDGTTAGYLVLTDVWFPGWTCTVDGQPTRIHRANYLFRAVAVPAGAREVVFTFAPNSYAWGKTITGVALVVVALILTIGILMNWRKMPSASME
jgi:hypothetical protein